MLGISEVADVLFQLPAEQRLISRCSFRPITHELFSGGKDLPSCPGEANVSAAAVPAGLSGQKPEFLQPPQHLAQALPAHAEHVREVRCGGRFK